MWKYIQSKQIFMSLMEKDKNTICVNAMMNAFAENEEYDECIRLFNNYLKHHNYMKQT